MCRCQPGTLPSLAWSLHGAVVQRLIAGLPCGQPNRDPGSLLYLSEARDHMSWLWRGLAALFSSTLSSSPATVSSSPTVVSVLSGSCDPLVVSGAMTASSFEDSDIFSIDAAFWDKMSR